MEFRDQRGMHMTSKIGVIFEEVFCYRGYLNHVNALIIRLNYGRSGIVVFSLRGLMLSTEASRLPQREEEHTLFNNEQRLMCS